MLRPERSFTGVSGPSGPKIAKQSQKESFWGSAKKSPKIPEKVKNNPQSPIFCIFSFSGYIRGLFWQTPKKLFLRNFCDFGPGGPGDSCKWSLGSQFLWPKMSRLGPPFWPKTLLEHVYVDPFFAFFPRKRGTYIFSWGPQIGCFGWEPNSLCWKSLCFFFVP